MRVIDTFKNVEYEIDFTHHNRYHPAKFSDVILDQLAQIIPIGATVLDVCSGIGKLGKIKDRGWQGYIIGQEIEEEWALQACKNGVDIQYIADATDPVNYLQFKGVNVVCTSPVYGNRLSDHFNPGENDKSFRMTYKLCIGRDLHIHNTGRYRYQPKKGGSRESEYCHLHKKIWDNVATLDLDLLVVNVSNYIVKGEERDATQWHIDYLESIGFTLIEKREVKTPRLRVGANRDKRVNCEYICLFKKKMKLNE